MAWGINLAPTLSLDTWTAQLNTAGITDTDNYFHHTGGVTRLVHKHTFGTPISTDSIRIRARYNAATGELAPHCAVNNPQISLLVRLQPAADPEEPDAQLFQQWIDVPFAQSYYTDNFKVYGSIRAPFVNVEIPVARDIGQLSAVLFNLFMRDTSTLFALKVQAQTALV